MKTKREMDDEIEIITPDPKKSCSELKESILLKDSRTEQETRRGGDKCLIHKFEVENWCPTSVSKFAITPGGEMLVLIRENGRMEFWETENWVCIKAIPGKEGSCPTGLCWCASPPRLFSSSLNGQLTEWNLVEDKEAYTEQVSGGGIWDLHASPLKLDHSPMLATACEDGMIRIFEVKEHGFQFHGQLQTESPRALCLDWSDNGSKIMVGYADGTIRVWSLLLKPSDKLSMGQETLRITLTSDGEDSNTCHVCSVLCLDDGEELVCGDSYGRVSFWDGKFGNQLCTINKHHANVTLLQSFYQRSTRYLVSSGSDGAVIFYERINEQWKYKHLRRSHIHDILCLKVFQHHQQLSIVTSSQDTLVRVISCFQENDLVNAYLERKLSTIDLTPEKPLFSLVPSHHLLMVTYDKDIEFWTFPNNPDVKLEDREDGEVVASNALPQLISKLKISKSDHLLCSTISIDLCFVAFSTLHHCKVMSINMTLSGTLEFHGMQFHKKLPPSCQAKFSQDSKWLFLMDLKNNFLVVDMKLAKVCFRMSIHCSPLSCTTTLKLPFRCHPKSLELSQDGQHICIQYHTSVGIYSLPKDFPKHGVQKISTIQSNLPIASSSFLEEANTLLIVAMNGTLQKHNFMNLEIQNWNVLNLNKNFFHSIIPTSQDRKSVFLVSGMVLVHFGLDHPVSPIPSDCSGMNPRIMTYDPSKRLLFLGFFQKDYILHIQADWKQVLKKRPAPVYRHCYGS